MKDLAVHFSSATCEWSTPQWLFDALAREFAFTLDPCATRENAKCPRFFTREADGLAQDWGDEVVFMNPPYGKVIGSWIRKAYESAQCGATVVCLVPARTDTEWWHEFAMRGEVRLLKGRLKFGGSKNSAPFPSAIVVFRPAGVLPDGHGGLRTFDVKHPRRESANDPAEERAECVSSPKPSPPKEERAVGRKLTDVSR